LTSGDEEQATTIKVTTPIKIDFKNVNI